VDAQLETAKESAETKMLTRAQHKLLTFICEYIDREHVAPTYAEMQSHMGEKSRSGVHRLVHGLKDRGYIDSIPAHARSLEVLRGPDGAGCSPVLTRDETRALAYLRRNKAAMAEILARCP
jgi:SOS-response transcriptional repressor LexA